MQEKRRYILVHQPATDIRQRLLKTRQGQKQTAFYDPRTTIGG